MLAYGGDVLIIIVRLCLYCVSGIMILRNIVFAGCSLIRTVHFISWYFIKKMVLFNHEFSLTRGVQ